MLMGILKSFTDCLPAWVIEQPDDFPVCARLVLEFVLGAPFLIVELVKKTSF
jgi:hypothetical protein